MRAKSQRGEPRVEADGAGISAFRGLKSPRPAPPLNSGVRWLGGVLMTARSELHRAFAERFQAGKRIRPATAEQLADAEAALGVLWPESYRQFAMAWGAVYTPSLLDLVVEHKPGFGDVQQFLTPKQ